MPYILRRDRDSNRKVLRPVRPNVGVEVMFRRRLYKIIEDMHASMMYWITAEYKRHMPVMSMDASPAIELRDAMRKLTRQWEHNFDELADFLADYFAKDVADRSDTALQQALRNGGFTVKFVMTPAMRDIIAATVAQNVSLIKSIPQQYLTSVEGMVMRSVQRGRDLHQLSEDLQTQLGVTKRRAALIARDQNNKASAAMLRARQTELGITEAVWMHSHAGKVPRRTHVKMDGKRYDVSKGMWDSDEGSYVLPGELINCRCTSRSVIEGIT